MWEEEQSGSENQQNERKKNNSLIPPSFQTKLLIEIKNATRQKKSVENSQILIFSEENCSRLRKTLERIGSSLIIFQIRNTSLIRNKTVESVLCSSICCEWATEPRLKMINSIREQLSLSINIRTEIYPGPPRRGLNLISNPTTLRRSIAFTITQPCNQWDQLVRLSSIHFNRLQARQTGNGFAVAALIDRCNKPASKTDGRAANNNQSGGRE